MEKDVSTTHQDHEFPSQSASDVESISSDDSFTTQLDQIGRLNLLNSLSFSSYLPNLALELPSFDYKRIPDLSDTRKFIRSYTSAFSSDGNPHRHISSIRTIISSRLQMTNILNDLNLGISLASAIDRLQPLKDVIREAVMLPVDDDYVPAGPEAEVVTEPTGIADIVSEQDKTPFLNELVIPEEDLREHQRHHQRYHQGSKRRKRARQVRSAESSRVSSELDIEGLSLEETRELTNLDSLDDLYKERVLRNKIQKIQRLDAISQVSKNKLVTRLMMGNYYKYVNERLSKDDQISDLSQLKLPSDNEDEEDDYGEDEDETDSCLESAPLPHDEIEVSEEDEVMLTEKDKLPSYHDAHHQVLGCPHYQRNCKIECPTCLKWFPCRFCHDQVSDHKLVRSDVRHILCMFCTTPQEPNEQYCIECEKELANYVCFKCKLYDNDYKKDIYHCDKCGICRLGLGLGKDYFHCDTCNICLSIDLKHSHKCLNDTTHCDCPICSEYLFTSVTKVVFMKCGHSIHDLCYKELTQHSYKCPICKKTVVNMDTQFRILDQEILQQPLPLPYKLWRCIVSCNDCKGKCNVAYHLLGLKCKYCNSYNTTQLKLIKPEEETEDEVPGNDSVDRMKLVQTSLSDNFLIGNDVDHDGEGHNRSLTEGESELADVSDEDDKAHEQNLVNIKRFTHRLLNRSGDNEMSYVTSLFQRYINQTLKSDGETDTSKEMPRA
ncbi:hypothetical protein PSN45_000507 [Yamadazyma tenuis]|uniref:Zf-CHY-domain-containing protein n=1 Tax=Candida tenuis (strain ATCC 10573 / BCRC 21748 / CBS 615 / JCM 9827 / NBRC 10315 / NRRL Y-1498 / VKM Y-70) TaxID=590646 RepID=G3B905_CANTC|nr:zf-CHY-domain-containing protein [Yamadazyma tenuis ATCC 10573]EGV61823.1 zf-CHY-domain-containing protein [Yamadazyma tenuis ATCC 10573]WEJ93047.1 hypothetical protein PSN45_000507 [Yamadazyma tenuis]